MFEDKKALVLKKYSENEVLINILFFLGGVLFDVFTLGEIDSFSGIIQQIIYLGIIGIFLYFDLIHRYTELQINKKFNFLWTYRDPFLHFFLGGLLSLYSLFFIKSASFFSSSGFIAFMLILLVGNEMKVVQKQKVSLKIGLYFICLFSFFSMLFPIVLGFVGRVPFVLSLIFSSGFISLFYLIIYKKIENKDSLRKAVLLPTTAILIVFLSFYHLGWIPPVPLSVKEIGVYHKIEKNSGEYLLYSEQATWKFWLLGDQNFKAVPGDAVYIFVRVFSPARFNDTLFLNWQIYNLKKGWISTDKVPFRISGGREKGYRGYSFKENYIEGDYRVIVETSDQKEVGRINFKISKILERVEGHSFGVIQR